LLCGTKTKNSILRLKSAGEPSQRASQTSLLPTGGVYLKKSEPIFKKTPTLNFSPPPQAAGKETRLARGQKNFKGVWGKENFLPARPFYIQKQVFKKE